MKRDPLEGRRHRLRPPGASSGEWKGALTGSITARLMPCSGASATARSTADVAPLTTTCPGALSLPDDADLSFRRRRLGDGLGLGKIGADERGHGAGAHRDRLLAWPRRAGEAGAPRRPVPDHPAAASAV